MSARWGGLVKGDGFLKVPLLEACKVELESKSCSKTRSLSTERSAEAAQGELAAESAETSVAEPDSVLNWV